jgi:hypothetical protein
MSAVPSRCPSLTSRGSFSFSPICSKVFLIAGEVHDLAGEPRPVREADRGQVEIHEAGAARHVVARELGAVLRLFGAFAQVADVVEQREEDAHRGALGAQRHVGVDVAALVTHHQPRHRERHIERVLLVVVNGVHAEVTGHAAREGHFEIMEGARDRSEGQSGPGAFEQFLHRIAHVGRRAHPHGVGDVVIAAAGAVLEVVGFQLGSSLGKTAGRTYDRPHSFVAPRVRQYVKAWPVTAHAFGGGAMPCSRSSGVDRRACRPRNSTKASSASRLPPRDRMVEEALRGGRDRRRRLPRRPRRHRPRALRPTCSCSSRPRSRRRRCGRSCAGSGSTPAHADHGDFAGTSAEQSARRARPAPGRIRRAGGNRTARTPPGAASQARVEAARRSAALQRSAAAARRSDTCRRCRAARRACQA